MKIDDLLKIAELKSAIHRNKDRVNMRDLEDFVDNIKKCTSEEIYNNIYIHELFTISDGHYKCKYSHILDKFKIIMIGKLNILVAYINEDYETEISTISYREILRMTIKQVENMLNCKKDAWKLIIEYKNCEQLILDTSSIMCDIRDDMNNFLIELNKDFNKSEK